MGNWVSKIGGWALVLAVLASTADASADVPAPPGTKFVKYGFWIENLREFKDFVVFAYPWDPWRGSSPHMHVLLSDEQGMRIGRHDARPRFYAMKRVAYEEWRKHNVLPKQTDAPALERLVKSPQVIACDHSPKPRYWVSSRGHRRPKHLR